MQTEQTNTSERKCWKCNNPRGNSKTRFCAACSAECKAEKEKQGKAHPFELAGMGTGPFTFVGTYEIPVHDDSAASFANPNPYADAPRLVGGLGTCANCGMAISNICIVRNSTGQLYGVGCDCVEKTGDKSLGDPAKVAIAKIRNRKAKEATRRREEIRQREWLKTASVASDALPGETNGERNTRKDAQRAKAESDANVKRAKVGEILTEIAVVIEDGKGGFCDSVARDMKRGFIPSGRGLDIAIDIYSKAHGRRKSNGYEEANRKACKIIEAAQSIA